MFRLFNLLISGSSIARSVLAVARAITTRFLGSGLTGFTAICFFGGTLFIAGVLAGLLIIVGGTLFRRIASITILIAAIFSSTISIVVAITTIIATGLFARTFLLALVIAE